jgi:hypothetical protein
MNRVLVKFHPSSIPEDEKQRRLWEAMGILLRTSKKKCKKSKGGKVLIMSTITTPSPPSPLIKGGRGLLASLNHFVSLSI